MGKPTQASDWEKMSSTVATKPGFNLNSIDVYETYDLPEVDQHLHQNEETTESIENIAISANEAFGRFKGAYIYSSRVDFSDKLRNSKRKGYNVVWSGEPSHEKESAVEKYQRLNCEIRELLEEMNTAK